MLSQEREKIREEEERKLEKAKQELETKLNLKEMQLQEMIAKQNALEEKLNDVYKEVPEIKGENTHLVKERDIFSVDPEPSIKISVIRIKNLTDNGDCFFNYVTLSF